MEEMYYYWLHNVAGIGNKTLEKLLKILSPKELYESSRIQKLWETKVISEKQRRNLEESKVHWNLEKEWEKLQKRQIQMLIKGRENYPRRLEKIYDAPMILYQKGKEESLKKPTVAVIGARACSSYGSYMAKELGKELARREITVVSGMARGIDGICQWAALEQGGDSIGVLGCGTEICYPPENRSLYERLIENGCLVSENLPFAVPKAGFFPLRNRIISGLADLVVVVESAEKSGTLITVDMALEQGKDVYAVPGRVTDPVSKGCNALIRQGAGIILSVEEFIEEICPILKIEYRKPSETCVPKLSEEEKCVLHLLKKEPKTMEELYQKIQTKGACYTLDKVMEVVLELQLKKVVQEENGYYVYL